jgi:hypothetical protein
VLHTVDEGRNGRLVAADAHQDAVGIIEHFAHEPELTRIAADRRSKTDTLHPSPHANLNCHRLRPSGSTTMQIHG